MSSSKQKRRQTYDTASHFKQRSSVYIDKERKWNLMQWKQIILAGKTAISILFFSKVIICFSTHPDWCSLRLSRHCSRHSRYRRRRSSNPVYSGHCCIWTERWSRSDYILPHHCCPRSHYLENRQSQTTPAPVYTVHLRSHWYERTHYENVCLVVCLFFFAQLKHLHYKDTHET